MKIKWINLISDAEGSINSNQYVRHIPGNVEYAAVCEKPELSKKTKQKKAALPVAQNFKTLIATSKAILKDPARRAIWQARYDVVKRDAEKRQVSYPGRLCDFVRHEVSVALKNGETIA